MGPLLYRSISIRFIMLIGRDNIAQLVASQPDPRHLVGRRAAVTFQ